MAEFSRRFPAGHQSTGEARRTILRFAGPWFDDEQLADIQVAVGEALANAAEHGFRPGSEIEVRCTCDGRALVVEIKDAGDGFRVRRRKPPRAGSPRGYGTSLMRAVMDRVRYSENGTRVRLTKFVSPARSGEIAEELA